MTPNIQTSYFLNTFELHYSNIKMECSVPMLSARLKAAVNINREVKTTWRGVGGKGGTVGKQNYTDAPEHITRALSSEHITCSHLAAATLCLSHGITIIVLCANKGLKKKKKEETTAEFSQVLKTHV